MTKQEEIREGITKIIAIRESDGSWGSSPEYNTTLMEQYVDHTREILEFLHSQGVVIKVDRVTRCKDCPHNHQVWGYNGREGNHCDILFELPKCCHKFTTDYAGRVAVEPLIKEEKMNEFVDEAMYNQQKLWEQEQEYQASESAKAEANTKAQEEMEGYTVGQIVREYFPDASDDFVEFIVWEHTGFPCFWSIPEDGNTVEECFRKQLKEFQEELQKGVKELCKNS